MMAKKKAKKAKKCSFDMCKEKCPSGGCMYFLGFLGAAIYNISVATGFWVGVWGVIKALVWPAFLVFELMKFIGM